MRGASALLFANFYEVGEEAFEKLYGIRQMSMSVKNVAACFSSSVLARAVRDLRIDAIGNVSGSVALDAKLGPGF